MSKEMIIHKLIAPTVTAEMLLSFFNEVTYEGKIFDNSELKHIKTSLEKIITKLKEIERGDENEK